MKTFKDFIQEPIEALRLLERLRDKKIYQQYKELQNPPEQDPLKPV